MFESKIACPNIGHKKRAPDQSRFLRINFHQDTLVLSFHVSSRLWPGFAFHPTLDKRRLKLNAIYWLINTQSKQQLRGFDNLFRQYADAHILLHGHAAQHAIGLVFIHLALLHQQALCPLDDFAFIQLGIGYL